MEASARLVGKFAVFLCWSIDSRCKSCMFRIVVFFRAVSCHCNNRSQSFTLTGDQAREKTAPGNLPCTYSVASEMALHFCENTGSVSDESGEQVQAEFLSDPKSRFLELIQRGTNGSGQVRL